MRNERDIRSVRRVGAVRRVGRIVLYCTITTASWKRYNMNLGNYCVVNPGFVRNSRNLASTVDTKDCNDPIMTE
jgi:hypothetical protein